MRARFALLITFTLLAAGCLQVQPQPTPPPSTISSWSPLGGFTVSSGANCGGHVTLATATATVNDDCFTGAANVVLCTDTTSVAAVKCTPGYGILTVTGTTGDVIGYARVK